MDKASAQSWRAAVEDATSSPYSVVETRDHINARRQRTTHARPCHTRVSHVVCHARVTPQVSASYVIVADMHGGIVAARVGERYMRLNGQGGVEGSLGDDGGLKVTTSWLVLKCNVPSSQGQCVGVTACVTV